MKVSRRNFVTGALVIVSVALATWLLILFFLRAQTAQRRVVCTDNLRQIGQALQIYIADNDGYLPGEDQWRGNTFPARHRVGCPVAEPIPELDPPLPATGEGLPGYAFNARLGGAPRMIDGRFANTQLAYAALTHPQNTIAVFDYTSGLPIAPTLDTYGNQHGGWPRVLAKGWQRHDGGGNYLFCDGHVGWFTASQIMPNLPDICHGDATHPNFCTD